MFEVKVEGTTIEVANRIDDEENGSLVLKSLGESRKFSHRRVTRQRQDVSCRQRTSIQTLKRTESATCC